jgi:hypothetical protein
MCYTKNNLLNQKEFFMSKVVFIDECGYTGEDLFNSQQPIFVLASMRLTEYQCNELKLKHFGEIKAKELKHSQLSRRKSHQKTIIRFLKDIIYEEKNIKFAIAHKRYVLVTKMVDILIETIANLDGIDLYKDGANIAYSNVLYLILKRAPYKELFEKLLINFQIMIRERTDESYNNFFRMFYKKEYSVLIDKVFAPFINYHHRIGPSGVFYLPENILNIAFSEALSLTAEWSKTIEGNWSLIHDNSSNMAKQKDIWDTITHPEVPPVMVGYDRRKMEFPLRVVDTKFEKSEDSSGLQLVDIMAGAMARCLEWESHDEKPSDPYAEELSSFLPESFGGHIIWPTSDVTPEALGTIGDCAKNPIDHFAQLIEV